MNQQQSINLGKRTRRKTSPAPTPPVPSPQPTPEPVPSANEPVIVDNGDHTVVTIKPTKVYLKQDTLGGGIDMDSSDKLVVNGPLFKNGVPVGGYINDGKIIKKFIDPLSLPKNEQGNFADNNGVFGQDEKGNFFVLTKAEWDANPINNAKFAFQNGPVLLNNGNNPHSPTTPVNNAIKDRSAIGYTSTGELIVIHSKTPINMHTLAEYMRKAGAVKAIYLDGAISGGFIYKGNQEGLIPDNSTTLHIG